MRVYADASMIAALSLGEPTVDAVVEALSTADRIYYTDFGIGETYSAISIAVRTHRITADAGERLASTLLIGLTGWTWLAIDGEDVLEGVALVRRFELRLRMPDALHLAVAKRHGATLLSGDRQQVEAARKLGVNALPIIF